jgi:hypothetical protein
MSQLSSVTKANELLSKSSKDKNFLAAHKAGSEKIKLAVTNAEKATTAEAVDTHIKTLSAELKKLDDAAKSLTSEKAALKAYRKSVESIEDLLVKRSSSLSLSASDASSKSTTPTSGGNAAAKVPWANTKPSTSTPPPRPTTATPQNPPPRTNTTNTANAAQAQPRMPLKPTPEVKTVASADDTVKSFQDIVTTLYRNLDNLNTRIPLILVEVKAAMKAQGETNKAQYQACLDEIKGYEPMLKKSYTAAQEIVKMKSKAPVDFKVSAMKRAPDLQAVMGWSLDATSAASRVTGPQLTSALASVGYSKALNECEGDFKSALHELQKIK